MTDRPETRNTLTSGPSGAPDFDYMRDDVKRGNLDDGFYDAAPVGNYEASLESRDESDDFFPVITQGGTLHTGQIEPDGFRRTHGDVNEFGFVRRPTYRSDVERT